ncbi:hypothetical protein Q604_UNBC11430G0001, partial [human gut metagenome]
MINFNVINNNINNVNAKTEVNAKAITDNSKRIDANSARISNNEKAINELKGHVGTQITNIENTITNKINE